MNILKIGILGISGVFLALILKKERGEYSTFISLAVCICIFVYILTKVETLLAFIGKLDGWMIVDNRYFALILKMIGITYVAEFAMNICKDAGYSAVAGQIELFAKLSILVVSLPVLNTFLDVLENFL